MDVGEIHLHVEQAATLATSQEALERLWLKDTTVGNTDEDIFLNSRRRHRGCIITWND